MKVKLLKKLRKRYNWYFNKDKFPILIDHLREKATVYDLDYLMNRFDYSLEKVKENVKVDHTEWALRWLKTDILGYYGWSMSRINYRLANRKFKKKLIK